MGQTAGNAVGNSLPDIPSKRFHRPPVSTPSAKQRGPSRPREDPADEHVRFQCFPSYGSTLDSNPAEAAGGHLAWPDSQSSFRWR